MYKSPLAHYFYLRRQGYRPRVACFSCLMLCRDKAESGRRMNRVAQFLNRLDIRRDEEQGQ